MRILLLVWASLAFGDPDGKVTDTEYESQFDAWRQRYNKHYSSQQEKQDHFKAFKRNFDTVQETNAKGLHFKLELNAFADIAPEDFALSHGTARPRDSKQAFQGAALLGQHEPTGNSLPSSVDWYASGAVTPVQNQGTCGACWAFATTAAIEGAWFLATKANKTQQLLKLSEQQLVDCSGNTGMDCHGGRIDIALQYMAQLKQPVCTEGSYPYAMQDQKCREQGCTQGIFPGGIVGIKNVQEGDEAALMDAVAQQPTATSISADQIFQLYSSGIFKQECGQQIDHAVLIVGYGTENDVDYWTIKNSWGTQWGEDGFGRIRRGGGMYGPDGECKILTEPVYPVVDISAMNAGMHPFPLGWIILASVLGSVPTIYFIVRLVRWMRKCRSPQAGTEARARPLVTPVPSAPQRQVAPVASQALQQPTGPTASADQAGQQPDGRTGNSAGSRLLQ